ncbi:MAG TPA: hypothetical protein VF735_05485 [Pyrinomonadaceae bacterium]|jgi:hypothetical protein
MAKDENKRIRPALLQTDEDAFAALQTIEGYAPANSNYTLAAATTAHAELAAAQARAVQAEAAAAEARDTAVAKEWAFHNMMLGVKDQVVAQFGKDSSQVQALGLKRKSEYRSPGRGGKNKGEG